MSEQEFLNIMSFLVNAYGKDMSKDTLKAYYMFFRDVPKDIFKNAIFRLIEKEKYFPSIAVIKSELVSMTNPQLNLSADGEWANVYSLACKYGSYGKDKAKLEMSGIAYECVCDIGWQKICFSDYPQNEQKLFINLFNSKKSVANEKALTSKLEYNERKLLNGN